MKKLLALIAIGAISFGVISAAAASLGTFNGNGTLGAATTTVAACNGGSGTVTVTYTTEWDATDEQYEVNTATIVFSTSGCDNLSGKVTLVDTSGASIGEETFTVGDGTPDPASTGVADFSADDVSAEDVTGIAIVVP